MRINRIFEGSSDITRLFIGVRRWTRPVRGRRPHRPAGADRPAHPGGRPGRRLLCPVAAHAGHRRRQKPRAYSDFGPLATHLRYAERASRKLARVTFYGMARWQGPLEHKSVSWAGSSTSARSCSRSAPRACGPSTTWRRPPGPAGRDGGRAGRPVLHPGAAAGRGTVRPAVAQHRQSRRGPGAARAVRPLPVAGGRRDRSVDTRAADRRGRAGPGQTENVHRSII